jgi:hypothetical protein
MSLASTEAPLLCVAKGLPAAISHSGNRQSAIAACIDVDHSVSHLSILAPWRRLSAFLGALKHPFMRLSRATQFDVIATRCKL